jgi:RNA polymerase sigma factor (sigma-70 family)
LSTTITDSINTAEEVIQAIRQLDHVTTARNSSIEANLLYYRIMSMLRKLPQREKQAVGYTYLYHYSQKRVAEKMDLSRMHVYRILQSAESNIKNMVREGM